MSTRLKRWLILVACLLLAGAGYLYWAHTRLEFYETLESPDHRFKLMVYRKPIWPSSMPGQASDAPGIVRLYDGSGRLLNEAPVDMVQQLNDVEWSADHVDVPLVFNFKLPK
ncbi:MAG TPA: hypothetical protein VGL53_18130 [Bryobacteraceae bacterium]|jgi:hypothetical protein